MASVTLRIPMIASSGPLQPAQMTREFQGALPASGTVAFVARIIREGLESAQYPDYHNLNTLADEYLVQEAALVKAVPNDVWIRNRFYSLDYWHERPARSPPRVTTRSNRAGPSRCCSSPPSEPERSAATTDP